MRIAPRFRARTSGEVGRPLARRWWIPAAVALLGITILAIALSHRSVDTGNPPPTRPPATSSPTASLPATVSTGRVEVPRVIGATLSEARVVLTAASFEISLTQGSVGTGNAIVTAQVPEPGTVADDSSVVTLTTAATVAVETKPKTAEKRRWTVVIDPGHQEHSDSTPEPIGPGAKVTKPSVTGGTTGVETGIPEYEVVLQISTNLKNRLEKRGVKVVMTRTTNDVSLSNADRAAAANNAHADIFVRVHADGSPDRTKSGISTLYPADSRWTQSTWQASKRAAAGVQASTVRETGAVDLGTVARSDISGFNYATMPSILIECGFMSNPVEDRLLASPHYQDKLAEGIALGVIQYLSSTGR